MHYNLQVGTWVLTLLICMTKCTCNAQPTSGYSQQGDASICNMDTCNAMQTLEQRLDQIEVEIQKMSTSSTPTGSELTCPSGFLEINSSGSRHCYSVISKPMRWNDSYNECITRYSKAHLVMVADSNETNFLRLPFESISVAERQICTDGANRTWFWTAGQTANPNTRDVADTFYWKYLDSFGQVKYYTPITYENWESGEPNYGAQFHTWSCIMIDGGPNSPTSTYLKWGTNPIQAPNHPEWGRCGVCEIDMS